MTYTYDEFVADLEICGASLYEINTRFVYDMWSQPHRRYHDLSHLKHGLTIAQEVAGQYGGAVPLSKVVSAWVLHDLVYAIGCKYNESNSATFVSYVARENNHPEIIRAVLATATHDNPRSLLDCVIIDMDLWGLGSLPHEYTLNKDLVEAEYRQQYSEEEWDAGRQKFLATMLQRKHIYWTPLGSKRESRAFQNMTNEQQQLIDKYRV